MTQRTLHYAWIVALVTFLVLLVTAGIRATPGVLMVPLESEFGWNRAAISAAVAINIALFGLIGPFAASVMQRWGLRRIVLGALALLGLAVGLSTKIRNEWEFTLLWGVLVGTGTGVTSMVLAAVVATRWFDARRGLVMGALSAANATGQLVFLPMLARLVEQRGWRSAAIAVAIAAAIVFVIVLVAMRDRPEDLGLLPYGREPQNAPHAARPALAPLEHGEHTAKTVICWPHVGTAHRSRPWDGRESAESFRSPVRRCRSSRRGPAARRARRDHGADGVLPRREPHGHLAQ